MFNSTFFVKKKGKKYKSTALKERKSLSNTILIGTLGFKMAFTVICAYLELTSTEKIKSSAFYYAFIVFLNQIFMHSD